MFPCRGDYIITLARAGRFGSLDPTPLRDSRCTFVLRRLAQYWPVWLSTEFTRFKEDHLYLIFQFAGIELKLTGIAGLLLSQRFVDHRSTLQSRLNYFAEDRRRE